MYIMLYLSKFSTDFPSVYPTLYIKSRSDRNTTSLNIHAMNMKSQKGYFRMSADLLRADTRHRSRNMNLQLQRNDLLFPEV